MTPSQKVRLATLKQVQQAFISRSSARFEEWLDNCIALMEAEAREPMHYDRRGLE